MSAELASSSSSSIVTATAYLEISNVQSAVASNNNKERLPPLLEAFSNNKTVELSALSSVAPLQGSHSQTIIKLPVVVVAQKANKGDKKESWDESDDSGDDENELFIDLDANSIHVASAHSHRSKSTDVEMSPKKEPVEESVESDDNDDDEDNVILDLDNNTFIRNPPAASSITITKLAKENE
jgi:hypothetical protein